MTALNLSERINSLLTLSWHSQLPKDARPALQKVKKVVFETGALRLLGEGEFPAGYRGVTLKDSDDLREFAKTRRFDRLQTLVDKIIGEAISVPLHFFEAYRIDDSKEAVILKDSNVNLDLFLGRTIASGEIVGRLFQIIKVKRDGKFFIVFLVDPSKASDKAIPYKVIFDEIWETYALACLRWDIPTPFAGLSPDNPGHLLTIQMIEVMIKINAALKEEESGKELNL